MIDSDPRLYPSRPILAASIAVIRGDRILLAQRTKPPSDLLYSLPGGVVEAGEPLAEAALRELREETGVSAALVGFNDHVEVIERDTSGGVARHFVIACFVGRWLAGEGKVGPEAQHILWVDAAAAAALPLTSGLLPILDRAFHLFASHE